MSRTPAAELLVHPVASTAADEYLGPALVTEMTGTTPVVHIAGAPVRAELALAFPYEPVVGDELLVIGRRGRFYVIGVLRAHGQVALRFAGDVKLQSVGGRLELVGDEGVAVRGKSVEIVARSLKTLADSVVERANDVYRRVRDTLSEHVGEKRELTEGAHSTRAESVTTVTSGVVTINGKEIHLG